MRTHSLGAGLSGKLQEGGQSTQGVGPTVQCTTLAWALCRHSTKYMGKFSRSELFLNILMTQRHPDRTLFGAWSRNA